MLENLQATTEEIGPLAPGGKITQARRKKAFDPVMRLAPAAQEQGDGISGDSQASA
ncbi:MAG: hypothetical protein AB9869_33515 [Verrucomicrobiia bacterium]